MIKVYKVRADRHINESVLRVPQSYRFTPGKEYISRCKDFNIMLVYDDFGNGIEFLMPIECRLEMDKQSPCMSFFEVIDSWEVENKKELFNEISKTIK